jgi:hypothetical protein
MICDLDTGICGVAGEEEMEVLISILSLRQTLRLEENLSGFLSHYEPMKNTLPW